MKYPVSTGNTRFIIERKPTISQINPTNREAYLRNNLGLQNAGNFKILLDRKRRKAEDLI